jgi:hypothetical protein
VQVALVPEDVQDLAVLVVQRLDERRHEPDRLGLPHEREVEHDAGGPLLDEEARDELAGAHVERHVGVFAAHDDDRESWRLSESTPDPINRLAAIRPATLTGGRSGRDLVEPHSGGFPGGRHAGTARRGMIAAQ